MIRRCLLFGLFLACAQGQTRRAVVVGINEYQHTFATAPAARRIPLLGKASRNKWVNLDGAVSDAREMREMLTGRLGFAPEGIQMLLNEQATGDAILGAIQTQLVDAAQKGDISLFYYAGHGSQIRNTKSDEADGLDESLVPADGISGTADIRDRELARLYRQAVEKGVRLTVILDSCHSGSGARGALAAGRGKMRRMENDTRYVEDPPDRDGTGKKLAAPEEAGALILSAAQDFEPAYERVTESGPHGLFSWALFQTLRTSPANERADRLFQRIRAFMQSEGATQEPVMAGRERTGLTLLGLPPDSGQSVTAAAIVTRSGQLRLQAGAAVNLTEGCEFKRLNTRIRVSKVMGVNLSEAVVIEGDAAGIQSGDLFELDRWAIQEASVLRVYVPRPMEEKALRGVVEQMQKAAAALGVEWIADPTERAPDAVVSCCPWQLRRGGDGASVDLGTRPAAALVTATLREWGAKSLYVHVPPTSDIALRAVAAAGNIAIADAPEKAHYVLLGRAQGERISYAWALPGVSDSGKLPLPVRTDWSEFNAAGVAKVAALARIRSWLLLTPPPADLRFPYRLVLRPEGSTAPAKENLKAGGRYKLFLDAPAGIVPLTAAPAWVYVFAIDSYGRGTLLFPEKGRGNVGNRLPIEGADKANPPGSIPLTQESYDVEISPPYGVDNYFLLVSKEALSNPDVLDFDGVRQAGRGEAGADPLTRLLANVGEGTRGQRPPMRATWSLYRESFRTAPPE